MSTTSVHASLEPQGPPQSLPYMQWRSPASDALDGERGLPLSDHVAISERHRLAQELHDTVTQTIFSASLIADSLPDILARQPEAGYRGLTELRELTHRALAETRALLSDLRSETLTAKPLSDLLGQLTQEMCDRAHIPINLKVEGRCSLWPDDVQITLYRVAQEALNNVAKHAHAHHASVRLRCRAGRLVLRVADDGCGCDPCATPPGHLGIDIMRERAQRIDATFRIASRPGCGTQVVIRWQPTRPHEETVQ